MRKWSMVVLAIVLAALFGCSSGDKEEKTQPQTSTSTTTAQTGPVLQCQERFAEIDVDKDGKVTLEEFTSVAHPGGQAEPNFKGRDQNGDGVLVVEEFCRGKGLGRGPGRGKQ